MNRQKCGLIRTQLQAHLNKANIAGCVIELGQARFDSVSVTFKVEVRDAGAPSSEEVRFTDNAAYLGLKESHLGKQFKSQGFDFRIAGMTRGGKVIATRVDNKKQYTFRPEGVRQLLDRK